LEVNAARALSATDSQTVSTTGTTPANVGSAPSPTSSQGAAVVASSALSAGQIPVDLDRVTTIKKAIQTGNYPIVPTKIGDAMIAAGLLLRGAK
jgi:negative regulator of flagellin synthesis FlgM